MIGPNRKRIQDVLRDDSSDFLQFCELSGKEYVDELLPTDFIAFRSQYGYTREEVEILRNRLDGEQELEQDMQDKEDEPKEAEKEDNSLPIYVILNVDPVKYSSVSIDEVGFNNRLLGRFKRLGLRNLTQVLSLSREKIINVRGLGRGSVKNTIETISGYISTEKLHPNTEKANNGIAITNELYDAVAAMLSGNESGIQLSGSQLEYLNKCKEAAGILGNELCLGAIHNEEPTISILNTLRDFCMPYIARREFESELREIIKKLPEPVRQTKTKRLFRYYIKKKPELEELYNLIPAEITIEQFPRFIPERLQNNEIIEMKRFLNWANYDAAGLLTDTFDKTKEKNQRYFTVLCGRADGDTLEDLGTKLNLTRERVRQVEKKAIRVFLHYMRLHGYDPVYFICAELDKEFLYKSDIASYAGETIAQVVWFLAKKNNLDCDYYYYSEEFNAVLFEEQAEIDEAIKLIASFNDCYDEAELTKYCEAESAKAGISSELLKESAKKLLKRYGTIYSKEKPTALTMCSYILKNRFINGYRMSDENDRARFKKYLEELFGYNGMTERAINVKVGEVGVLIDRGTYIHPDYADMPVDVIMDMIQYIEDSPRTVLTYTEIYNEFANRLVGTKVSNRYYVQGIIKQYGCPYFSRKDYITKEGDVSLTEQFNAFLESKKDIYKSDINEEFPSYPDYHVAFLIARSPEIIPVGPNHYIHSSLLDVSDTEKETICDYLHKNCESVPVSARTLLEQFNFQFIDFIVRNEINDYVKLFYILRYLFQNEFKFSFPYISTKDSGMITTRIVLLQLLSELDSVEIEDYLDICRDNGINFGSVTGIIECISPEWIRVDVNTLMKRSATGITDDIVYEVAQLIEDTVQQNGGYRASKLFDDYGWYPSIDIEWNPFVLESIATIASDRVYKIKISSNTREAPLAIFVDERYSDYDYNAFLLKVLSEEHRRDPFTSMDDIVSWMTKNALFNIKIPEFLEKNGHIYYSESGHLEIT